jgi:GTP-binding protein EngB required for normal cell division
MDLKTYEQVKFELAELIRSGELVATGPFTVQEKDPNKRWNAAQPFRDLLTRLADDRFTIVVAGRFNRGKSSLMNAVLGVDRLPTWVVPLTSVITYVRYGTSERVLLDYYGSGLRGEARLEELPELVTEKGNPGNVKRIRAAEIQLPSEILRRGFFFVDTPGLGSAIFENSQTTERFIPEIDVLILVTSYESPLTEDEIRFLRQASASVRAVFVVVNKQDTVSPETRHEVLDYVAKTSQGVLNGGLSKPFSVSARDGLTAKQANDMEGLRSSGILDFEEELIHFLTAERSRLFLSAMFDRASVVLGSLPEADAERL